MFVVWGPSRTLLYNDAYVPLLGSNIQPRWVSRSSRCAKHPHRACPLFDRLFRPAWSSTWTISPSPSIATKAPERAFRAVVYPDNEITEIRSSVVLWHPFGNDRRPAGEVLGTRRDHKRLAKIFDQAPSFIAVLSDRNIASSLRSRRAS